MSFSTRGPIVNLEEVRSLSQLDEKALAKKQLRDQELAAILRGEDQRILLVIGPCSSDNEEAVLEYAKDLAALQEEVKEHIFMVMRVYTAKPRTNGDGYKGLIHQPDAAGTPNLMDGIKAVRNLHYRVITETAASANALRAGITAAESVIADHGASLGQLTVSPSTV